MKAGRPQNPSVWIWGALSAQLVYRWIHLNGQNGLLATDYTPSEYHKLKVRLDKFEHEFEIIQLSKLLQEVTLQKRLAILEDIYRTNSKCNVHELCEALDVSRGTII